MPGLFRNSPETREGKFLVVRRDGTVPEWEWFVLGDRDPAAPVALLSYAAMAEALQMDPQYVADVRALAAEWAGRQATAEHPGDPDAGRHRPDDPKTVAQMRRKTVRAK